MPSTLSTRRAPVLGLVAILAGAATAACGPIVFIGLVVPHLARALCGPDHRWVLPYSMLLAPVVLLLADVLGRVAGAPGDLKVGGIAITGLALGGAIVAALLMYVLAWRDGVSGYRFVLIGIGAAAFFEGLTGFVLTRAQLFEARQAMHWLTGSVGQAGDTELRLLLVALAVLLPLSTLLQRQLRVLELGDGAARGLGVPTELARAVLLATAVVLVALAVAAAGPLVFVALVAGPVANRLLGPATGGVAAAALDGFRPGRRNSRRGARLGDHRCRRRRAGSAGGASRDRRRRRCRLLIRPHPLFEKGARVLLSQGAHRLGQGQANLEVIHHARQHEETARTPLRGKDHDQAPLAPVDLSPHLHQGAHPDRGDEGHLGEVDDQRQVVEGEQCLIELHRDARDRHGVQLTDDAQHPHRPQTPALHLRRDSITRHDATSLRSRPVPTGSLSGLFQAASIRPSRSGGGNRLPRGHRRPRGRGRRWPDPFLLVTGGGAGVFAHLPGLLASVVARSVRGLRGGLLDLLGTVLDGAGGAGGRVAHAVRGVRRLPADRVGGVGGRPRHPLAHRPQAPAHVVGTAPRDPRRCGRRDAPRPRPARPGWRRSRPLSRQVLTIW